MLAQKECRIPATLTILRLPTDEQQPPVSAESGRGHCTRPSRRDRASAPIVRESLLAVPQSRLFGCGADRRRTETLRSQGNLLLTYLYNRNK